MGWSRCVGVEQVRVELVGVEQVGVEQVGVCDAAFQWTTAHSMRVRYGVVTGVCVIVLLHPPSSSLWAHGRS